MEKEQSKVKESKYIIGERTKLCPSCGEKMHYVYGELFECQHCGVCELSDFGKVKEFLNANGPQPAIIINEQTGVAIDYINHLLKEGRIEIPDGSEVYIKCQKCGADIRYGRFCPECMMVLSKDVKNALWMPEVGEKPKIKPGQTGKMHILEKREKKNNPKK